MVSNAGLTAVCKPQFKEQLYVQMSCKCADVVKSELLSQSANYTRGVRNMWAQVAFMTKQTMVYLHEASC